MAKKRTNNYYNAQTEREIVTYATNKCVSMADLASKMNMKDSELFCMLSLPMTYNRKQEIKALIDELHESNQKPTEETFDISELNFLTKASARISKTGNTGILLSAIRNKGKLDSISISFRNGIDTIITSTKYMQIALYKNRLYFKESNEVYGYKICEQSSSNNNYFQIRSLSKEMMDVIIPCVGEYDLKQDERLGLYYAELETR